jgi:hypothetical protein
MLSKDVSVKLMSTETPGLSKVPILNPQLCSQSPSHWRRYHSDNLDSVFIRLVSMARDGASRGICFPGTWIALCEQCRATSLVQQERKRRKESRHHEDLHTRKVRNCRRANRRFKRGRSLPDRCSYPPSDLRLLAAWRDEKFLTQDAKAQRNNDRLRHSRRKRAWPAMMMFEFP